MKFRADPKDWLIFILFALFLLFLCSIGASNLGSFANTGQFIGITFQGFSPQYIALTLCMFFLVIMFLLFTVGSYFFDREKGFGFTSSKKKDKGYSRWCTEKEMKKQLSRVYPGQEHSDAAGIPIINNGIAEKKQFKFEGIREGKINILFAGRIVEQKGISVLSAVINKLNTHINTFYFHIVGEGHLKEDLVKELEIFDNVHFYGNVYNLAQYLHSFDFLFMPSVHEGLSMLSIESSFAKLPVIINSCEGLVDTVPNAWPLKVKDNNVDDFVEVFNNIRNLDRKVLAESAYQFVSDRFGIEQMQNQYIEYYKI